MHLLFLLLSLILACSNPPTNTQTDVEKSIQKTQRDVHFHLEQASFSATIQDLSLNLYASFDHCLTQLPQTIQSQFISLIPSAEQGLRLLKAWSPPKQDDLAWKSLVLWAIHRKLWDQARLWAWQQAAQAPPQHKKAWIDLWYRAFEQDPTFLPPKILTLLPNVHITQIKLLSHKSTSFLYKLKFHDKTIAAFKVMQKLWLSNYRGEIAAYRLCPLIHCGFEVPYNREARVSKKVFDQLHKGDPKWIQNRHQKGIKLIWFQDDQKVQWLYGTYKAWVPGFTQFPIEDRDKWLPLLTIDGIPLPKLKAMSFKEALKPFAKKYPKKYRELLQRAENIDAFHFAAQLSNLHVFDLLINNWDRYTSQPYPGLNCQWNHGVFVSIDNGATFQNNEQKKARPKRYAVPRYRIKKIQRFSKKTIQAIRWMDTQTLFPILFPPSPYFPDEKERYQLFLERRTWLLHYVDALIQKYGEDQILVFP